MKKLAILIIMGTLVAALAMAGVANANGQGKGPADKATGDIEYYQPGYHFSFNAHGSQDGRPVKGVADNLTAGGDWYHAEVRCVNKIDENTVLFAAELISKSVPTWGPWVLIQVYDGGEPGAGVDQIWGQFMSEDDARGKCDGGAEPSNGPWNVLSGNLQVHK